jgi:hypothetical protein
MEAVYFSETLVSTYKSTRNYNPEDQHQHLHRRQKNDTVGDFSFDHQIKNGVQAVSTGVIFLCVMKAEQFLPKLIK